mmetsp:Transcript_136509/g.236876  ORF Transcript_136509/g.236876 Transcript_136509/m.236876 type:complete len:257 (-) Transcript_136509:2241-3011(-)
MVHTLEFRRAVPGGRRGLRFLVFVIKTVAATPDSAEALEGRAGHLLRQRWGVIARIGTKIVVCRLRDGAWGLSLLLVEFVSIVIVILRCFLRGHTAPCLGLLLLIVVKIIIVVLQRFPGSRRASYWWRLSGVLLVIKVVVVILQSLPRTRRGRHRLRLLFTIEVVIVGSGRRCGGRLGGRRFLIIIKVVVIIVQGRVPGGLRTVCKLFMVQVGVIEGPGTLGGQRGGGCCRVAGVFCNPLDPREFHILQLHIFSLK